MVRGHLKLIDFGISKAIMNDTTNIVRENQVGTVNYMSPEALQESSGASAAHAKGIIKIGRPSDVWSLGCILYEMTFGKAPFANFSLIQRLQKIMDYGYQIEFPDLDNSALLNSIRGCLERSIKQRLTIEALLTHPFLMPHREKLERPLSIDLREALSRLSPEARAILDASLRHL
jgi:serine/threonine-protein kinase TTK/MPS1